MKAKKRSKSVKMASTNVKKASGTIVPKMTVKRQASLKKASTSIKKAA